MKELLEKLLGTEMLNEDTKNELMEAINKQLDEAKEEAKQQAITEVKAEYAIQFVAEKEQLVEALDTKVEELLKAELDELKEDIERFRDLEAEHATKLVEAREEMAKILESDLNELVNTLDTFLEERLNEEFKELKEDIEIVKQNELGRKIFEAVAEEFEANHARTDDNTAALSEAKKELKAAKEKLDESNKRLASIERDKELTRVLESLQGRPKEIMEAILKSVPTNKLNEAYDNFIGRVLHESAKDVKETKSEQKENSSDANSSETVLAESETAKVEKPEMKVVTGDTQPIVENKESAKKLLNESERARLHKLAGIG